MTAHSAQRADRAAGRARPRRRAGHAGDAVDHHRDLRQRAAHQGGQRLGRRSPAAAAVLGLLASGLLLEVWSWRSVFGLNVVLAAVAIVGTLRFVPESADPRRPAASTSAAPSSPWSVWSRWCTRSSRPRRHGWLSARTLVGLAAGLVVLAGFVALRAAPPHPMLDPRIFAHRGLSAGSLSIFVQFFAFFGFIFLVLQYLQLVRGDSALVSAVSMLPMAAAMMPTARLAPALVARFGARAVCVTGLVLIAGGLVVLAQLDRHELATGCSLAGLLPLGAGMGAGHDAGHQRHHLGPARVPAGRRLGDQRPVPRGRRRARHRRAGQHPHRDLPEPPAPGPPARRRSRQGQGIGRHRRPPRRRRCSPRRSTRSSTACTSLC